MKSLNRRLSEIVSPYDEVEKDQNDLVYEQYIEYQKDSLIKAIGEVSGYQEFDLYFDELMDELETDDKIQFLTRCIEKLSTVYPLDITIDYIKTQNLLEINWNTIIDFIKFFVYNHWIDSIVRYLPLIDVSQSIDISNINKKIKESYLTIQEKIIGDKNIHPLIRYHFTFCARSDGEKTLLIWINKDITGVISKQLNLKLE
ncbi:MAG: hypothetical protein GYA02_09965 [Clostridiaceae bacterium]|jgi:hypothetical protein|nr:hypothetical protein [Clostridiaceae bacterium]